MVAGVDFTILGRPTVQNARVLATVEELTQTEKVIIMKKRRRKGYQKNMGHRQWVHMLRIDSIDHNIS